MPRYIALLRGINVGGHRVKMDHLRALFVEMGFDDVQTFIASGNVIFSAARDGSPEEGPPEDGPAGRVAELESSIATHLEADLGFAVPTLIRTPTEIQDVVDIEAPERDHPDHSVYVMFMKQVPGPALQEALGALESDMDRFEFRGREIYWLIRGNMSDSPLFKGNALTKAMKGVPHTARNLTSLQKLLAKHGPGTGA